MGCLLAPYPPASASTSIKADHTLQDHLLNVRLSHEIMRSHTAGISLTPSFPGTPPENVLSPSVLVQLNWPWPSWQYTNQLCLFSTFFCFFYQTFLSNSSHPFPFHFWEHGLSCFFYPLEGNICWFLSSQTPMCLLYKQQVTASGLPVFPWESPFHSEEVADWYCSFTRGKLQIVFLRYWQKVISYCLLNREEKGLAWVQWELTGRFY